MKNYAIVADGIIVNVIVADEAYAAQIGAVPVPEGQWIGDEYIPEPTIEERVEALEVDKADKTEVSAIWDSMAAAYSEGVASA